MPGLAAPTLDMMILALLASVAGMQAAAPPHAIHLEAEEGTLAGVHVAATRPGYTGTGYVTGFEKEGDHVAFHFQAPAGLYIVRIRYCSPSGPKGFGMLVDSHTYGGTFDKTGDGFASQDAGKVELTAGDNTLELQKGWGYFDIDAIDLVPTRPEPPPPIPPARVCDQHASAATVRLFRSLAAHYGRRTLSGQFDLDDCAYVHRETGEWPAIVGGDFMDYSPSRVARSGMPKDGVEQVIAAARAHQEIVTMCWHWNAPTDLVDKVYTNERGETVDASWYRGFYTYATTFNVAKALADPSSADYALLLRDIDAIAVQLKKFAAAGIPVLWRPLHEADGRWFWWGAQGPEAYKKLWRLLHERLTAYHGLHNLIWVSNCANAGWYPGDDSVDIVGIDAYPSDPADPQIATWDYVQGWLKGRKMLAITEFGGVPDVARMYSFGARWSFFVSWTGDLGPHKPAPAELKRLYREPLVINVAPTQG